MAGNYRQPPPFLKHNQSLVRDVEKLESKARRRDLLVEEDVLFDFYEARVPHDCYTASRLQSWLKKNPEMDKALRLTREDLLARDPGAGLADQFPDQLQWQDQCFRLSYQFEPGREADGVSVTVPVALLNRVPRFLFDWLVPGLLREKCIALVKALPKEKRKKLVPVPNYVDRALDTLQAGDCDLLAALALELGKQGGLKLSAADWDVSRLDDFYRMNIRVVDADGRLLEQGRDLDALVRKYRSDTRQSLSSDQSNSPAREGITRWDFDSLEREWRFRQAGVDIVSFPALADRGDTVAITLCDYPDTAEQQHRLGSLRLLQLHSAQTVKYLRKQLVRGNEFNLVLAGAGLERAGLVDDLIDGALVRATGLDDELPYTREAFLAAFERGRPEVVNQANEMEATLLSALQSAAYVRNKLAEVPAGKWPDSVADMQQQLRALLQTHFMRDTPAEWFTQYPRYMKALRNRVERLSGQYARDQQHTQMLVALEARLQEAEEQRPGLRQVCDAAMLYRWMLEEFRVSLFAQNLGTRQAVSQKRLQAQWAMVEQWVAQYPR